MPAADVRQPPQRQTETFYEAQRRHRRSSWWLTLLTAVSVAVMGLPLSVVVGPVVVAVAVVLFDLADLVVEVAIAEILYCALSSLEPGLRPCPRVPNTGQPTSVSQRDVS